MTKTGQIDHEGFVTVRDKKGSDAYTLYVTYTADGPRYDAVGIDGEHDEFEVEFSDESASISTTKFKYLMLRPEQLRMLADLIEEADEHAEAWSKSRMGQEFEAAADSGDWDGFLQTYKEVLNIRSEA